MASAAWSAGGSADRPSDWVRKSEGRSPGGAAFSVGDGVGADGR